MENYQRNQIYFPTFNKLVTRYCTALDRFPTLIGQLSFHFVMEIMFVAFSLTGIVHFTRRFLLTFPFLGIFFSIFVYQDMILIIFLAAIFFTSVALNKI